MIVSPSAIPPLERGLSIANYGGALHGAELAELVRVAVLDGDEDHRAEPAGALLDVRDPGDEGNTVAGTDGLEVFPLRSAVEPAELGHLDLDFGNRAAQRAAEGRRRDHSAEARRARRSFVAKERVGIADGFGEPSDRTALDLEDPRFGL